MLSKITAFFVWNALNNLKIKEISNLITNMEHILVHFVLYGPKLCHVFAAHFYRCRPAKFEYFTFSFWIEMPLFPLLPLAVKVSDTNVTFAHWIMFCVSQNPVSKWYRHWIMFCFYLKLWFQKYECYWDKFQRLFANYFEKSFIFSPKEKAFFGGCNWLPTPAHQIFHFPKLPKFISDSTSIHKITSTSAH